MKYKGPITIVLAMLAIVFCIWRAENKSAELERENRSLKVELAHATIPIQKTFIRDSIPVVMTKVITVDRTDYKKQLADKQLIKDLQIRISELEAENRQLLETSSQVTLQPTEGDSIHEYHDKWADFRYQVPTHQLDYAVRDSIVSFITRIPKHRFLWWRWGTKGYEVRHVNFNPNAKVNYNSFIKLE